MYQVLAGKNKLNVDVENIRKELDELKQNQLVAAPPVASVPDHGKQIEQLRDMLENTVPALITKYDTLAESVCRLDASLQDLRALVENAQQSQSTMDGRILELQNQLATIHTLATEEP
jgi:chromosome segregation ATPase